jgi:hypothetical protein
LWCGEWLTVVARGSEFIGPDDGIPIQRITIDQARRK